jgi:sensor histidine kinase YesM
MQDSKGFIWLASGEGLARYDGFECRIYTNDEQTSKSGSNIMEDKLGRIWYKNFDGYLYYVQNDSLHSLKQNKPIGFLSFGLNHKHLFVFQEKGVDIFDIETLTLKKTIELNLDDVAYGSADSSYFYFFGKSVLYTIDNELKISTNYDLANKGDSILHLHCVNNKVLIFSKLNTRKRCYIYENGKIKDLLSLKDVDQIQGITYADKKYWVLTPKGAYAFSAKNPLLSIPKLYFKNKSISSFIVDKQNNYWFSTTNDGVLLVPDHNAISYSIENYSLNAIVRNTNGFILSTINDEILSSDFLFTKFNLLQKNTANSEVFYLHVDTLSNTAFYVSKFTNTLDLKNNTIIKRENIAVKEICEIDNTYYAHASSGLAGLLAKVQANKNENSIWDSLHIANLNEHNAVYSSLLSNVRAKSVCYNAKKQRIIYATNIGLFAVNTHSIKEILQNEKSFYSSKVCSYNDSIYTLSTKGNLYLLSENDTFIPLNNSLNIAENTIKKIKCSANYLFIFTEDKLLTYNFLNKKTKSIDVNLSKHEINDVMAYNHTFYLVTSKAIITIPINRQQSKSVDSQFVINGIWANDFALSSAKSNTLSHNNNTIEINYSILNFGTSIPPELHYKINNSTWIKTSTDSRSLRFPALAPGEYSIDFMLNDVHYNKQVQFIILPPFWQQWHFIFFSFLLLLSIAFVYYKWQVSILQKRNKLLTEKILLEQSLSKSILTAIKSQMNPHFFYNALNTIQSYIFTNDKRNASNYLSKFSKLTRMILEMSEKESIYVQEEINALKLYLELEKMRFESDFTYSIEISKNLDIELVKIPSMILQPYVENAVKHGLLHKKGEKNLLIKFEREANFLKVNIDDNGIGRKRSEELNKIKTDKHESFATKANEKRLEILNRGNANKVSLQIIDKADENNNPSGTCVIILIPVS